MGDDDRREGPSLELPSWRLGRRRRSGAGDTPAPDDDTAAAAPPAHAAPPTPTVEEPQPQPGPQPEPQPERPLFADEAPTAPAPRRAAPAARVSRTATATRALPTQPETPDDAEEPDSPVAPKAPAAPRRRVRRPALGGLPASALAGVVTGLLTVALTWGSERGCGAVRGTSTCGGGPGLLLLVAILVVMALLGAALLRALAAPAPGSTSVLGTGLLGVVTLLFFVGVIFEWWMVLVVPLCAGITFALAHWVSTTYVEPEG